MKFRMVFKTPRLQELQFFDAKKHTKKASEAQLKAAWKFTEKYVEFGKEVTVDFDTEDGTATVREVP